MGNGLSFFFFLFFSFFLFFFFLPFFFFLSFFSFFFLFIIFLYLSLHLSLPGGAGERIESTLSAFRHAYSQGTEMFEVDAQMTADGRVVVCHDDDLNRLTDVSVKISQVNYAGRVSDSETVYTFDSRY